MNKEDILRLQQLMPWVMTGLICILTAPLFLKCYNKQLLKINIGILIISFLLWVITMPITLMATAMMNDSGNNHKEQALMLVGWFIVQPILSIMLFFYTWNKTRC